MMPAPAIPLARHHRRPDWQARLLAYLHETRQQRPLLGHLDCWLGPIGAIDAMTGSTFAGPIAGSYDSLRSAHRALIRAGGPDLLDRHFVRIDPARASAGDLAVLAATGRQIIGPLGIVQGEMVYVWTAEGLGLTGRHQVLRAYEVPSCP